MTGGGVAAGVCVNPLSRIDVGALPRVDISCRKNARPRKRPPAHQAIFVSTLPACLVPMNESAAVETPPNEAASPPPFADCMRTAATRTRASMMSMTSRKVYILNENRREA